MTFQLNSQGLSAAQQLYDKAYAIGGTAFANLALGAATTEGITPQTQNSANIWGNTGDSGLSYGPLQLYTRGGIGNALNGDVSPDNQLTVGLNAMYNGGNYNLRPWNGPANYFGGSAGQGNRYISQTQTLGANQAALNGITPGASANATGGLGNDPTAAQLDNATPDQLNAYATSQGFGNAQVDGTASTGFLGSDPTAAQLDNAPPDQLNAYATSQGFGNAQVDGTANAGQAFGPDPYTEGGGTLDTSAASGGTAPQDSGGAAPQAAGFDANLNPTGGMPGPLSGMGIGGNSLGQFAQVAGMIPGPAGQIAGTVLNSIGSGSLGAFGSGAGGGAGTPQTGGDTGPGAPIVITDISSAGGKGAGPQVQKGLETAGGDIQKTGQAADTELTKDTTAITTEGTKLGDFLGNLTAGPEGLLVRGSAIAIGGVLILMGLWLAGKNVENV